VGSAAGRIHLKREHLTHSPEWVLQDNPFRVGDTVILTWVVRLAAAADMFVERCRLN
jgi:hypothetical protein